MIRFPDSLPSIMGIVNVTPDSFSDGGAFFNADAAIRHAVSLVEQGADILDVGGESTRPGAKPVDPMVEQQRVIPVIKGIVAAGPKAGISIDTRNAATMRAALAAGATMVNDVSALGHDPAGLDAVAHANCHVCLMHARGTPETMQDSPHYDDVVSEILAFLAQRIEICVSSGIAKDRIVVDPGIGFGKTLAHNLTLIAEIGRFQTLGVPVLLGASRKGFISHIAGNVPPQNRVAGSVAAALAAASRGVDILRVHDVAETRQALLVWQAIQRSAVDAKLESDAGL